MLHRVASSSVMHTSEVYAGELKKTLKEGDALWFPEPLAGGEVQIGDVGYMHEGAFIRLFNVVDPEKYPVPTATEPDILPEQFEPLNDRRAKRLDERPRALGPGPYKSKSVVTRTVEASASAYVFFPPHKVYPLIERPADRLLAR